MQRWLALFVAFAATLVFVSYLFVEQRGDDGPCCARLPPRLAVSIVDEEGIGVDGAWIHIFRDDTLALRSDSSIFGWLTYDLPENETYRLAVAPPRGWVVADSSAADETVYMDSTGATVRFVLRRAR